jgi:cell division protein FtsQ
LERVKAIPRNASAAEADSYRSEMIADDEPRYLRRQKPVEIRRKKFGAKGWPFYRRLLLLSSAGIAGTAALIVTSRFLLYSPQMLLLKPDQVELTGNRVVAREAVLQSFARDRNRSILRVPLDARRTELEQISWVESASVQRILPNRIRVELTERTPIAFARNGNELALIDSHGVILDRPRGEDLHFPIVSGVSDELPRDQREKRMQIYSEFIRDVDLVRGGSSENVSEADLSDSKDLRIVMTGLAGPRDAQAVTIHFGPGEFTAKYKMLVDNFSQWQAAEGCVQSIDLRFKYPVLNPDTSNSCRQGQTQGRR